MARTQLLLLCLCLVAMTTGCRNRCNQPCNGWLAGNSTIAPPPTYSLNIPSVASNQPYYAPGNGSGTNNTYTVNPNLRAPTPATGQAPAGWRPTNNQLSNGSAAPANESQSVLQQPTRFVETQSNPQQNPVRTASAGPLPGSGYSFTNSPNYRTTQTDERSDATRLPVTDASTVRAPARNFPTGGVASNPNYQFQQPQPGYVPPYQQTYVAQNGFNQPVNPYSGSLVAVQTQPFGYQGQAVLSNQNQYPTSSPPAVLAQSTATINPGNQLGWRSRELNSDGVSRF